MRILHNRINASFCILQATPATATTTAATATTAATTAAAATTATTATAAAAALFCLAAKRPNLIFENLKTCCLIFVSTTTITSTPLPTMPDDYFFINHRRQLHGNRNYINN